MAQGIAVSDQVIKDNPELVHRFVKAALHGMKDILDDPSKAADDFVNYVPEWKGKEGAVKAPLAYYATLVYPGQRRLGEIGAERLAKMQDFYLAKGIIQRSSPVEELYRNELIKRCTTAMDDPQAIGESKAFRGINFADRLTAHREFCKNE